MYIWLHYFLLPSASTNIWASPYDTQIRLTEGTFVTDGLVEIYCLYEWGTINRDGFDQLDADTICKQLGYTEASAYNHRWLLIGCMEGLIKNINFYCSIDGNTKLVFHFPNIDCASTDQCIASCQSCGIGNVIDRSDLLHSLSHKGDLYINCSKWNDQCHIKRICLLSSFPAYNISSDVVPANVDTCVNANHCKIKLDVLIYVQH